ncbi:BglG family transcription antiterminator [Caldibacillus debilis]|uniref:BglG family transcription antiterminator n=1 Tax=Caldibacillus debilis TaxID=301148 RepID=UPI002FD9975F
MNSRWQKIIHIMYTSDEPVTSSQLASLLQVSSKTVRNEIKDLNDFLRNAKAKIVSYRGIGYKLVIEDEEEFKKFLQVHVKLTKPFLPTEPEDRVRYLMEKLLLQSDFVKMDDIASELFISRSTLQSDIKTVRRILSKYHLKLEQKPYYGIKVLGDEMQIRFCISEYIFNNPNVGLDQTENWNSILSKQELATIKTIILSKLRKYKIIVSDISLQNLITHIAIACKRIREEKVVKMVKEEIKELKNHKEFKVAKEIVQDIENKLHVSFPENEVAYISIHLQGSKILPPKLKREEIKTFIDHDIQKTAKEMIERIDEKYNLHLSGDDELLMALCLHLKPAINRFKYKMNLRNPLLEEIKTKYPLSFEAAVIGSEVLEERFQIKIDENEIGYIALHIEVAMERQKKIRNRTPRCLIVCASGLGTAQLLFYKLKNKFGNDLNIVGTTEYYNLNHESLKSIDFIISTIPIKEKLAVPVIHVSTILGESDVKKIEKLMKKEELMIDQYLCERYTFLQMNFDTPEEVIRFLGEKLIEDKKVKDQYIDSVLEREKFSPTSFGNLVAIPHPIEPQTDETFWCIVTLAKPIQWGKKPVQLICLLNIDKNKRDSLKPMYSVLVKFLDNVQLIHRLLQCQTYDEFKNTLKNYR